MTTQKNVGWVRPEAVTHQDNAEWPVLPIEQIADVNPRIDKLSIPDDLPVSFVPMPAVGAGDGSIRVDETRPAREVKKGFTGFLEGDVLFAKITPCMENGKMAVVPKLVNGNGFGSTEFHVLRPKPGMDAKYLYYFVSSQSFRGEAERYMTGAVGQKRVSTTYLKESKIPVAPLDQQKHIVAEIEKQFSRLDEAVANLKRVKVNLKRYKAAVLKAAVEGRLVETEAELARRAAQGSANVAGGRMPGATEGRSYETGAQLLQRILETRRSQWKGKGKYKEPASPPDTTNLPELPEGWVWATVGEICFLDSGEAFKKRDYSTDGLRLLQIANVGFGQMEWEQQNYLPVNFGSKFPELLMCPGDIVLALNRPIIGERLKVACVSDKDLPAILYQRVGRLRPVTGISPTYLFSYFQSPAMLAAVRKRLQGTDQPYLNTSLVPEITIPLPSVGEQKRIMAEVDRRLSLIREVETQIEANLQRSERLRQSILFAAFSGRLANGGVDNLVESPGRAQEAGVFL
jgi:type I restriction enzyme S subunit